MTKRAFIALTFDHSALVSLVLVEKRVCVIRVNSTVAEDIKNVVELLGLLFNANVVQTVFFSPIYIVHKMREETKKTQLLFSLYVVIHKKLASWH